MNAQPLEEPGPADRKPRFHLVLLLAHPRRFLLAELKREGPARLQSFVFQAVLCSALSLCIAVAAGKALTMQLPGRPLATLGLIAAIVSACLCGASAGLFLRDYARSKTGRGAVHEAIRPRDPQ